MAWGHIVYLAWPNFGKAVLWSTCTMHMYYGWPSKVRSCLAGIFDCDDVWISMVQGRLRANSTRNLIIRRDVLVSSHLHTIQLKELFGNSKLEAHYVGSLKLLLNNELYRGDYRFLIKFKTFKLQKIAETAPCSVLMSVPSLLRVWPHLIRQQDYWVEAHASRSSTNPQQIFNKSRSSINRKSSLFCVFNHLCCAQRHVVMYAVCVVVSSADCWTLQALNVAMRPHDHGNSYHTLDLAMKVKILNKV